MNQGRENPAGTAGMAAGRGGVVFPGLGVAKQAADPRDRTRSPLPRAGSPASKLPATPGLNRPRRPSSRRAGRSVGIAPRRPRAPHDHRSVTASSRRETASTRSLVYPRRWAAPGWILQPAAWKVGANDRARPETPPSRVTVGSRADRPWLRYLCFQCRAFRCF